MPPLPLPALPDARVAHVGIAVTDLDAAGAFYRDVLGLAPQPPETADGATIVAFRLGDTDVELMTSRDPATPIGRYLARHGPGIHHVCLRVPDVAAALARCRAAGYRLIDDEPRRGAGGRRIAFVHPRATSGILIELTD
jgi:methylmalonyl-CoA/ethylmalonyl-CoA epimerase